MITAHLPSGYITGRALGPSRPMLWSAVLGGVLPDFDLIWFYLIDGRAFHHHHYWVHIPGFWALVALVTLPALAVLRPAWLRPALAFFAGLTVHLLLDSIAGDIKWLWPYSDQFFHLIDVPARQSHWVLNFILHPVFLAEIAIWATALWLWFGQPERAMP